MPVPRFCLRLLSNLVKQKPRAAEEVFHSIGEGFLLLLDKCCHAQRREVCFQQEVCTLFKQTCKGVLRCYCKENPSPIATVMLKERSQTGWMGVADHTVPGLWAS